MLSLEAPAQLRAQFPELGHKRQYPFSVIFYHSDLNQIRDSRCPSLLVNPMDDSVHGRKGQQTGSLNHAFVGPQPVEDALRLSRWFRVLVYSLLWNFQPCNP